MPSSALRQVSRLWIVGSYMRWQVNMANLTAPRPMMMNSSKPSAISQAARARRVVHVRRSQVDLWMAKRRQASSVPAVANPCRNRQICVFSIYANMYVAARLLNELWRPQAAIDDRTITVT